MPKKNPNYVSLFAKCYRNKLKTPTFFHLALVTILGGGEAKIEGCDTFLRFCLIPSLRDILHPSLTPQFSGEDEVSLCPALPAAGPPAPALPGAGEGGGGSPAGSCQW